MTNFTIANKIKIIHNFKPLPQPQFDGNENAMRYIIWNLYNRVCETVKSFEILLDNQRYYDAFIIAGHALETCSVLSYIKDTDSEAVQIVNYDKYMAQSSVARLIAILEMDSSNLEKDCAWNAYVSLLKIFYPVGTTVIKNTQNAEEKHKEIIEQIRFRNGTNAEKIKLLKNSYKLQRITDYISIFSNNMDNIDDGEFHRYYIKYCNHKHSNMLAPYAAMHGEVDEDALNLMLGIIMYLGISHKNLSLY